MNWQRTGKVIDIDARPQNSHRCVGSSICRIATCKFLNYPHQDERFVYTELSYTDVVRNSKQSKGRAGAEKSLLHRPNWNTPISDPVSFLVISAAMLHPSRFLAVHVPSRPEKPGIICHPGTKQSKCVPISTSRAFLTRAFAIGL